MKKIEIVLNDEPNIKVDQNKLKRELQEVLSICSSYYPALEQILEQI